MSPRWSSAALEQETIIAPGTACSVHALGDTAPTGHREAGRQTRPRRVAATADRAAGDVVNDGHASAAGALDRRGARRFSSNRFLDGPRFGGPKARLRNHAALDRWGGRESPCLEGELPWRSFKAPTATTISPPPRPPMRYTAS